MQIGKVATEKLERNIGLTLEQMAELSPTQEKSYVEKITGKTLICESYNFTTTQEVNAKLDSSIKKHSEDLSL